eukprot:CAMPEP_0116038240 /NCGR_PEP_ID=MMETSP0321-20121206/22651_1 /TAXON_ID=163516 /ORGANISM="Leptocylindrus danicus var. danicus, Strain B650" /LENGTH=473 /DNA_ID=CAMNT_0003516837 /DNA_START=82 /DNA_END=1503 /DNA_ORIENTATION=+
MATVHPAPSSRTSRRDSKTKSNGIVPTLLPSQVQAGKTLGEGGFCIVSELLQVDLLRDKESKSSAATCETEIFDEDGSKSGEVKVSLEQQEQYSAAQNNQRNTLSIEMHDKRESSLAMANSFNRSSTTSGAEPQSVESAKIVKARMRVADVASRGRYAIKKPKPNLPNDLERYKAIVDIQLEGKLLMTLSHPHIISIRAVSEGITKNLPSWKECLRNVPRTKLHSNQYFLVLDRLTETLTQRLAKWTKMSKKNAPKSGACQYLFGFCRYSSVTMRDKKQDKQEEMELEKMTVALSIARAIRYLHDRNIIYRDLKPDNIGFDERGNVKLFDFGLAKELHPGLRINDLYSLTGNTGSLRYMAPEVARKLPYDQRVDAYSFGLLFWQMCKLQLPFNGYTVEMHADLVVHKGDRPEVDNMWPVAWRDLMELCWHNNIYQRPSFHYVVSVLSSEVEALRNKQNSSNLSGSETGVGIEI